MMKIKIQKQRTQISEQKEAINEVAPLAALPAVLGAISKKIPWKKIGGSLMGALGIGGGNSDEKEADMTADAIHNKAEQDPLNVEGPALAQQVKLLAQTNDLLQSIETKIGQLPQDPDVVGSNTPDPRPSEPEPESPEPKRKDSKPKPRTYNVVTEIKLKINKKNKSL